MSSAALQVPAWVARLNALPQQVAQSALAQAQPELIAHLRRNAQKGGSGGLRVRSGNLLRSIRVTQVLRGGSPALEVSMAFYGWLHNSGEIGARKRSGLTHRPTSWAEARQSRAKGWADDAITETQQQLPRHIHAALQLAVKG